MVAVDLASLFFISPSSSPSSSSPTSSPSSCSSFSTSNLYPISVNWDESIDSFYSNMSKTRIPEEKNNLSNNWEQRLRFPIVKKEVARNNGVGIKVMKRVGGEGRSKKPSNWKPLEERVQEWVKKKVESGVPEIECRLPFLEKAPKLVECRVCNKFIYSDEVRCSVSGCQQKFHRKCAKEKFGFSRNFKCPQHACFICKQKGAWRCVRCTVAAHSKCAPWPDRVRITSQSRQAVCWRHPTDWRLEKECLDCCKPLYKGMDVFVEGTHYLGSNITAFISAENGDTVLSISGWLTNLVYLLLEQLPVPASDIEEIFRHLPLPYTNEEFSIDSLRKDTNEEFSIDSLRKDITDDKTKPSPYVRIRRNVYLCKKKRNFMDGIPGCTNCDASGCLADCVCRVQSISCSKECHCSETCTNRPFRKEKKIKVASTKGCGWGVEAAEPIKEGDFVIEYIGEVIDDALCEERFWYMRAHEVKNFYLCEIRKDFTIDATYKGNLSRFLNHSCDPNCSMEKWEVDGETRVGIFATRSIDVGEALTYDYRFVCYGSDVECHCGASNCQGFLGTKKKTDKRNSSWNVGTKKKTMKGNLSWKLGMTRKIVKRNLSWHSKRRRSTYWEMKNHTSKEMECRLE